MDFAHRKDIVIVNDNPYSFILTDHPLSILSVPGAKECCIEFNSMSKSHNMPGWRIGMLASNADFVQWILKVKSNIELQKNKIQLYCNQVYVTDSVEGIVPDFLTLLHGVIDSPDIPLNVSRSYLQSDSNVKKISTYISKKVSDLSLIHI